MPFFEILVGGMIVAAFAKSAQIGLHVWLVDAMEGPTPVSALIHAATMVTAGVFLILRLDLVWLVIIGLGGGITSLFSGFAAFFQKDIKKLIAYSTVSQIGYMFIAIGSNSLEGSLYHLTTHAFFKALLFLSAGILIYYLGDEQDWRKMGGLFFFLPVTFFSTWIADLALMGFPFFSGFYSKDFILEGILSQNSFYFSFLYFVSIFSAFFTILYGLKLLTFVFFFEYKGTSTKLPLIQESWIYMICLVSLSLLSIGSGYWFRNLFLMEEISEAEFLVPLEYKLIPIFLLYLGFIIYYVYKRYPFNLLSLQESLGGKGERRNRWLKTFFKMFWFDFFFSTFFYRLLIFFSRDSISSFLDQFGPIGVVRGWWYLFTIFWINWNIWILSYLFVAIMIPIRTFDIIILILLFYAIK